MMYYGGAGSIGWIWMGLMMIAFWALLILLVIWAIRSFTRGPAPRPPSSAALNILEERFARGEISPEEFAEHKRVIQGGS
jgi:putative membrane protein